MDLQLFRENGWEVRVVSKDGKPWFVASDVADALEFGNIRSSLALLDEDEKGVHNVDTLGGAQELSIINESGLYSLIMRSRKPEAKAFKKWVTSVVLPSIRKHGMYATPLTLENMVADPDWAIGLLQQLKYEQQQRELAIAQRDHAISTKAEIGSRREATAMATASRECRRAEQLANQLGEGKEWRTVKAIDWLTHVFAATRGMWSQVGKRLGALSVEMGYEVRRIDDERYGAVNVYHVDVIRELRTRIDADENMMRKYRVEH